MEEPFGLSVSPNKTKKFFSLSVLSASAVKTEPEDFSPPTRPEKPGLVRDAKSAEKDVFKQDSFCLSATPDKQKTSSLSDLSASAVKPYILFAAGRIIPSKGCHLLLKAFREIRADVELFVVGNLDVMPGYARELRELADGRVKFFPFIESGDDLSKVIRGSLFFVFPSSLEAMSMMLLEVAAIGTPILCSDIPENRAVLEDRALYFRSGDETDLTDKLRWAIEHPNDMEKRGYVSQDWVKQNYPWDKIANLYGDLYQKTVN